MTDSVSLNADAAEAALKTHVEPSVTNVSTIATKTTDLRDAQVPAKWGTEYAPSEFKNDYRVALQDLHRDVSTLKGNIEAFIGGINKAIGEFGQADADAAASSAIAGAEVDRNNIVANAQNSPSQGPDNTGAQ